MKRLRLLAILEADTITGPAKNLLQFAQCAREQVDVEIAVFRREGQSNLFIETAGRLDLTVVRALRSLAGELKPDVVQSHAVKSHFLTRASGLHRMAPWVAFH